MTNWLNRCVASPKLWQIVLAGYWLALVAGTHVPAEFPALPSGRADKLAHFVAYAVLAGLLAMTWQRSAGWLTGRHLRWAWIVLVVYAALDELTQIPVGRTASALDWAADALGALVGLMLFWWWTHQRRESCAATETRSEPTSGVENHQGRNLEAPEP